MSSTPRASLTPTLTVSSTPRASLTVSSTSTAESLTARVMIGVWSGSYSGSWWPPGRRDVEGQMAWASASVVRCGRRGLRRCRRLVGVGVGVGVGEGVLEAGQTWQLVSVFALALVEVPGLGEAAVSLSVSACAVPGRPASTPRVRKPPPSTLSAVTRTCARRMRIALSPLLIRVTVCSSWVRRRLGDGWVSILISDVGLSYACQPYSRSRPGRPGGSAARPWDVTVPAPDRFRVPPRNFVPSGRRRKEPAPERRGRVAEAVTDSSSRATPLRTRRGAATGSRRSRGPRVRVRRRARSRGQPSSRQAGSRRTRPAARSCGRRG